MGFGPVAFKLYSELNLLEGGGRSMCDLGSQDVVINRNDISAREYFTHRSWHYTCIDIDGRHDALRLDLNIATCDNLGTFDVVTNHGTTEHCFNQLNCFKLMHDLTKDRGLMVHVVPTRGYDRHCFYLYQRRFFEDLAFSNNYEVVKLYDAPKDHRGELIVAALRKMTETPFIMPRQNIYR